MRKLRKFPELAELKEAEWCWARLLMCTRSTAARSSGTSIGYQFRDCAGMRERVVLRGPSQTAPPICNSAGYANTISFLLGLPSKHTKTSHL